MTIHTIDDTLLNSPGAERYFCNGDRRIMLGLRAAVELLSIPLPDYARRRPPGPTPARNVAAAFAEAGAARSMTLAPRKENASPERIAALNAQRSAKLREPSADLFAQAFPA